MEQMHRKTNETYLVPKLLSEKVGFAQISEHSFYGIDFRELLNGERRSEKRMRIWIII